MKGYLKWSAAEHSHIPLMSPEYHISQQNTVPRADNWNGGNWVQGHDRQRTGCQFSENMQLEPGHRLDTVLPATAITKRLHHGMVIGKWKPSTLEGLMTPCLPPAWLEEHQQTQGASFLQEQAALPRILYRERTSSSSDQGTKYLILCAGRDWGCSWWGKHRQLRVSNKPVRVIPRAGNLASAEQKPGLP